MFGIEFYPTPAPVIYKMLQGVRTEAIRTVLEPSAGKGDIIERLNKKNGAQRGRHSKRDLDIDAIEIDPNLRHILKGKGVKVVHDDFLSFQTFKRYDLIIMNPPFSNGDKHLLKAVQQIRAGL